MKRRRIWVLMKVVLLIINATGLIAYSRVYRDFGLLQGLVCGVVFLPVLYLWVTNNARGLESLAAIDAPFSPMQRYPQAYWLTMGVTLSVASIFGMLASVVFKDVHAELPSGCLMVGLAMCVAVACAARTIRSR